jgi:hypothetical protein
VERGVVIGGLMICGSFLLAAMLNRSAMEERPAPAPGVPIEAVVPVAPPAIQPAGAASIADCADVNTRADANEAAVAAEPPTSDLMVNGREACPR